jgi:tetratricopeptide (TPR) repeat protein
MALVSVIIPVYKESQFLSRAIDSVFSQTFKDIELIVVYVSNSDSHEISKDEMDNLVEIRCNGGIAQAINTGIQASKGEYICWLKPSDFFLPYKLQSQMDFFKDNPALGVCYTDAYIIQEPNLVVDVWESVSKEGLSLYLALLNKSFIHSSTVMIKKECFEKVGLLNTRWRRACDFEWFLRASRSCEFGRIESPTVKISIDREESIEEKEILLENLDYLRKDRKSSYQIANILLNRGMLKESIEEFRNILVDNGCSKKILVGLGKSYFGRSLFREAMYEFKKVVEMDLDNIDALYYLARCLRELGCQEEVIVYCNRIIELSFKLSADVYNLKAMALLQLGRVDEAKEVLREGLRVKPQELKLTFETGKVCFEYGLYEEALTQFERVNSFQNIFSLDNIQREAYYFRGLCHFRLGEYKEAAGMFERSLGSEDVALKFYWFAKSVEKMGWVSAAIEVYKEESLYRGFLYLALYSIKRGDLSLWWSGIRGVLKGVTKI